MINIICVSIYVHDTHTCVIHILYVNKIFIVKIRLIKNFLENLRYINKD